MGTVYDDIISSEIFTFVIGPNSKEYKVHGSAISRLSKPLGVLLNGDMREAKEKCVKWPDVDEKTFVRFTEWAYKENYVTEEPDILLDPSLIGGDVLPAETQAMQDHRKPEEPLCSLATASNAHMLEQDSCWNQKCASYGKRNSNNNYRAICLACVRAYRTPACKACNSVYKDCPHCGPLGSTIRDSCLYNSCGYRGYGYATRPADVNCLRCCTTYTTPSCVCGSAFQDCPACAGLKRQMASSRRLDLIRNFLDEITSDFSARKNTNGCEDYTDVFLCHAKLYVLADTYDIPALKQLTLNRLHATLKDFTLYPSRMTDIATLAKYVFVNTMPEDRIRDIITLYYACIIEDARKYDCLKSVILEIPDFAFGLISKMTDRLA